MAFEEYEHLATVAGPPSNKVTELYQCGRCYSTVAVDALAAALRELERKRWSKNIEISPETPSELRRHDDWHDAVITVYR